VPWADGGLPGRVLHLWGVTPEDAPRGLRGLERAQELGFYSVSALAKALGSEAAGQEARLVVVTNGMQEVSREGLPHPEKATVLGACRVIPQEYAELRCRAVDVALPQAGEWGPEQVEALLAECDDAGPERVVAHRGIDRWVESFEAVRLEARGGVPARLKERGCYLVTGGLGGIGLALAEGLAGEVGARLVLVGRRGLPPRGQWDAWLASHDEGDTASRRIRKVKELESLGAEVLVASGDVCDLAQMSDVLAAAEARFGRIDGVIHAAGVAGGGVISLKTRAAAEAVLAPKLGAALVLEELLRQRKVDFVVVCSSLASVLGGFGQADYAAANAFLDAWARSHSTPAGPLTVSINWDTWREAGMAVETVMPGDLEGARQERLRKGLASREGVEAFRRILRERLPQVLVARGILESRRQAADRTGPQREAGPAPARAGHAPKTRHRRPALAGPYVPPRDELERTVADVWREFLGFEQIGAHDSFFDLGGHSLVATQIVNRLRETFPVRISLQSLFDAPTIAGLAEALVAAEAVPGQARQIARTVQQVEGLSAEELLKVLEEAKSPEGAP
jgi:NAD(P)-dependent dehydrogenase (short-subunit alcohol dehydrogenase family)/acyl carrier protein